MGRPKQLLPLDGRPLIEHALRALAASRVDEIVVVAGSLYNVFAPLCRKYRARIVRNPDPASDMMKSVCIGLSAARIDTSGILIFPADYPRITIETINYLLAEHDKSPRDILVPTSRGRRGHPVVFPRFLLKGLGGRTTLRDVMRLHAAHVRHVPVDDAGILLDIDTPEEYAAISKIDYRREFMCRSDATVPSE